MQMTTSSPHDPHYLAIGRMLVLFQSLEATLKDGLVLLINNQMGTPGGQLAYATVAELSFGSATRIASALPGIFSAERLGAKDDESAKRLKDALTTAEVQLKEGIKLACEAERRRNQLVHSRWLVNPEYVTPPDTMNRMKTKTKAGSMNIAFESESSAEIDATTEKARHAQSFIGNALEEYKKIARSQW